MKANRIFVTGGGGFLGRCLIPMLRQKGHEVDAPSSKQCDLTLADSLHAWTKSYDLIFHLAAWTQAGDFCLKHPGEQWVINQKINTHVLAWWQQSQPQAKAVLIGTSCAYDPRLPLTEDNYLQGEPIESLYTYAMTKRMLWVGALALARQYGLQAVNVVPSTLCGDYYHEDGRQMHFIYDLVRKILQAKKTGEPAVLWGNGHQKREVVLVNEFCQGILGLVSGGKGWGEVFNLGAGKDHSIREFAEMICQMTGTNLSLIRYDETKYTGAASKCLSIEKVKHVINWSPSGLAACAQNVVRAMT